MKSADLQWKVANEKAWPAMKSTQWKYQQQWKAANEKCWPAMKSTQWKVLTCNEKQSIKRPGLQWKAANENTSSNEKQSRKGLACNEKYPMKSVDSNEKPPMKYSGLQWKVLNENSWPAMKSSQWKGLASNEKWLMKMAGLQWKAANDKLWPAMKSYWKAQGLLWKNLHHKRAWDLYDILFIKVCGAMHIVLMALAMILR